MVDPPLDARQKNDPHVLREARGFIPVFFDHLPGVALTFAVAATAVILQRLSGIAALSPLLIAMALGVALRAMLGPIPSARIGIAFSLRRVLRFAIVLLGLQLTIWQVMNIGAVGFAIIVATLIASFAFTNLAGRLLGIDRRLTELIAAGTSICGASAVIAANTVTRAPEEDVAYAIACVTVFGTLAMLLLPALATALQLEPQTYGLWMGATIHEVAQAVAAAFQGGDAAGQAGTVAKLSRVMLLAPLILTLGLFEIRRKTVEVATSGKIPAPWFVFGFIAMVAVNSVIALPAELQRAIAIATSFLLAVSLGAMGLETDIAKLRAKGVRPFLLGFLSSAFIALFGLGLIAVFAV